MLHSGSRVNHKPSLEYTMLRRIAGLKRLSVLRRVIWAPRLRAVHTADDVAEHHPLVHEDEVYNPPKSFTRRSHIPTLAKYKEMYRDSIENPE